MTQSDQTIVYSNGGSTYLGTLKNKALDYWFLFGRDAQQKWMYKGYRKNGVTHSVVVFDTKQWNADELARRKGNGFLGIREYDIRGKVIMME